MSVFRHLRPRPAGACPAPHATTTDSRSLPRGSRCRASSVTVTGTCDCDSSPDGATPAAGHGQDWTGNAIISLPAMSIRGVAAAYRLVWSRRAVFDTALSSLQKQECLTHRSGRCRRSHRRTLPAQHEWQGYSGRGSTCYARGATLARGSPTQPGACCAIYRLSGALPSCWQPAQAGFGYQCSARGPQRRCSGSR
jgi:hypothetical protein